MPTEEQFLALGMRIARVFRWERCKRETNVDRFRNFYGIHPAACEHAYNLLRNSEDPNDDEIKLDIMTDKPWQLLMACRFLWLYPSERNLGQFFGIQSKVTVYKYTKLWVKRLEWLLENKLLGNLEDHDEGLIIMFTLDGTQSRTEEPRPFSTDNSSFKYAGKAGVNYELGLLIHRPRLIWVNGPTQPGKDNDVEVFRSKLKGEMLKRIPGRKGLADKGYRGEEDLIVRRNDLDPPELAEFKDRALARTEKFNGFLKKFKCLKDEWRHLKISHGAAFRAVCALTQCQIDTGVKTLFDPY